MMATRKPKTKLAALPPATHKATSSGQPVIARGPRKAKPSGPRPPRLTLHKMRSAWFRSRVAWPLREAPLALLVRERRRVARKLQAVASATQWELAGPSNIGGRCTSLVVDPANPDRIWIGSAGGGVWASQDAGKTWQAQWHKQAVLNIGALAIDPADSKILYCGTGEANLSADSYAGDGIYRSTNGGMSWRVWAGSATSGVPRRIGVIAVDPFDSKHVLVGGVGYGRLAPDSDLGGLYVTKDGGATWRRETFLSANNYWCHCVVFDPRTRGTIFAAFTGLGAANGVYRSTDGGGTWTQLTDGLPPTASIGRTSIAIAPSNGMIVYAQCADSASGSADRVLGVFRSSDGGNTWTNIAGSHFDDGGQMSYGNAIAVHPQDANHVICGGVDLHLTTDAGGQWCVASHWNAERGTPQYAHADHHALAMPAAAPGRVYSANDGGLDVSEDGGKTWTNRSNGLSVTMFYDMDIAQTDARLYGGGAQDNGTLITQTGSVNDFSELLGGDGGWMVVDPKEAGHIYASYQFGGMYRFRNGSMRKVSPPFKPDEMGGVWMVFITIDPNNSDTVFTGAQRVYRTNNDGLSWDALSPILDGSPISAIEVAAADSKSVYVGTENGGFFASADGGQTWSANLAGSALPGVMITRIDTLPTNGKTIFVTVGNFGNAHVFKSSDAGQSWVDIDGGQLPDVPHHAVLVRPDAPAHIYVCNDAGVFVSQDGGTTWMNSTLKLPNVMIIDLVYHEASKTLYAASYGRSIWRLKLA